MIAAALLLASSFASSAVVVRDSVETVEGEKLELHVAYDDALAGPRPGVLVFHHNMTGVDAYVKSEAKRLAEKGYFVVAPKLAASDDFAGAPDAGKLTAEQDVVFQRLMSGRSRAALRWLRAQEKVKAQKLAVVGYCNLGGHAAMNLARFGADVLGVAVLWGGVSPKDMQTSWPRRRVKPKILAMLGGRDVETNPFLASFQEEMRASDADWRLAVYGKAQHGFTMKGPHLDGRGEYDPDADRQSWRDLTSFLDGLFADAAVAAP